MVKPLDNTYRLLIVFVFVVFGVLTTKVDDRYLHQLWFVLGAILSAIMVAFFINYATRHQVLYEGGPMFCAIVITAIPILHLGHKAIYWCLLAFGLVYIQWVSQIDVQWSLHFFVIAALVMGAMQFQTDVLLRSHYKHELTEQTKAQTDKLTGIDNRYRFDKEISTLLANLEVGQHLSVAMIDIDHFKQYNDTYGHLEGDRVLVQVAQLLSLQDADLVVKFGGEEFILVAVHDEHNEDWLSGLPVEFQRLGIAHLASELGYVSASVGIAVASHQADRRITKKMLLSVADECLYQAKSLGRNQVQLKSL
ncbi:GGDEF domain-containing protein [Vibrio sinaloensis]|uniref:GGDEF domain-containing protein n=1 Tax=Photobacterium sp. (strain ATCC 43367) TaxID=379097 RepID=UPI00205667BE|nr:GGDEF domain-containing protein [Vibrio sinaloensis]UPQ88029.1 GGDEF domain-containing protein [Vibrio sinaloensis]